ncbi:MAG: KH domain-containing protein [Erysipelotrichaceae bacterium]|nr:KH domain-containing protein [Erysipelotrichaceae bacterium]
MKEYTGKTIEDILEIASKEKGVSVDELNYFIKEEKEGLIFNLGKKVVAEVYSEKDVVNFLKNYLDTFFNGLDLKVDVDITKDNDCFRILLNADNNAILIGKNGQTLEAINSVLKGAASSQFRKRYHILVDINNYKTDRYDKIKGIAYRVAKSVQKSHVSATLDPMPSDERRVIHNFLSEMANIRTESEGDGRGRRVKIIYDANKE